MIYFFLVFLITVFLVTIAEYTTTNHGIFWKLYMINLGAAGVLVGTLGLIVWLLILGINDVTGR